MPYFVVVIALVVIGVGFTFLNPNTKITVAPDNFEIPTNEAEAELHDVEPSNTTTDITKVEAEVKSENTKVPEVEVATASVVETSAPTEHNSTYADGTYQTQNSYRTPEGTYQMNVALTVADDIVTLSTVTFDSKGAKSGYSKRFNDSYSSYVVGKALGDINLSRMGGSSLTTKAFNTAIAAIKDQAS
jgi:hypothetical protein